MAIPVPMKADPAAPKPTLDHQIAEVRRELALRRNVYPKFVSAGKMKQAEAELCMARMEAALKTLEFVREHLDVIVEAVHPLRTVTP
jgi:hypothetical protein